MQRLLSISAVRRPAAVVVVVISGVVITDIGASSRRFVLFNPNRTSAGNNGCPLARILSLSCGCQAASELLTRRLRHSSSRRHRESWRIIQLETRPAASGEWSAFPSADSGHDTASSSLFFRKMFARGTFRALCSAIFLLNLNLAEWVDMPQFSDDSKIYRWVTFVLRERADEPLFLFTKVCDRLSSWIISDHTVWRRSYLLFRIPSLQQDQFYKFRRGHADNHGFPDNPRNGSRVSRHPVVKPAHATDDRIPEMKRIYPVAESSTASYLFPVQIADVYSDTAEENREPASTSDVANEVWQI